MIITRTLDTVLRQHSEIIQDDGYGRILRFPASGNLYLHRNLPAIANHDQLYIPIIDGIERADEAMRGGPYAAAGMVLKREGIIS